MASPFTGLSERTITLEMSNGDKIKVKPKVKDAQMFITLKQGSMTEEDSQKITDIMVGMIQRANPEEKQEDIEAYVALHYGELMEKIAVVYGFVPEKKIQELKEKRLKKLEL